MNEDVVDIGVRTSSTVVAEEELEDSAPELDEAVVDIGVRTSSTVDAEEELEDSAPELDEAVVDIGLVELDEDPLF